MINATEEATFDVLKHDLSRYLPIRIVLRKEDGKYKGLIENSFSMDYDNNRIRIWWSGKAYFMLGKHNLSAIDDAKYNAKSDDIILDPFSEDCPIEIDWKAWISAKDKFGKRNAPFKEKQ